MVDTEAKEEGARARPGTMMGAALRCFLGVCRSSCTEPLAVAAELWVCEFQCRAGLEGHRPHFSPGAAGDTSLNGAAEAATLLRPGIMMVAKGVHVFWPPFYGGLCMVCFQRQGLPSGATRVWSPVECIFALML